MEKLALCGQIVRVDQNGMINLTDMWKASGAAKKNKPSNFLRNDKVRFFVTELNKKSKAQKCALQIVQGGATSGTWGCKLLAYKYASWISPEFEVGVYTVVDGFFSGRLIAYPQKQLNDLSMMMIESERKGSHHGKGLRERRREKKELRERLVVLIAEIQMELPFNVII